MASNKKYWKSVEELNENSSIVENLRNNEFVQEIPTDEFLSDKESLSSSSTTRRDFLKYVGFTTAAASLAACDGPVRKAIPYVFQPEEIIPGIADYYATTIADGFDFTNILIKTREGRPISVLNNNMEGASTGANARVHASVLSLYDSLRLKQPKIEGKASSWSEVESRIQSSLEEAKNTGKQIVLLTNSMASPSTDKLIEEFKQAYPTAKQVVYDAVSYDAALDAYEQAYGQRALPDYDFDKADVIVSVGADFIGDWNGGGYEGNYAKGRIPKNGKMSKHIQFEANMSLTGANADRRVPMTVAEQKLALVKLYNLITGSGVSVSSTSADAEVVKAAQQLKSAGSRGVLVSGLDDVDAQLLVFAINNALASEVFVPQRPKYVRQGNTAEVAQLVKDMNAGNVHTLIMNGVNPLYTFADAKLFEEGLKKVKLSVTYTQREDETALATTIAAAVPHYLESWGDVAIKSGSYSITQPTIRPLFSTKQFQESLLSLLGKTESYYDYIKNVAATVAAGVTWNTLVHNGFYSYESDSVAHVGADYQGAASRLASAKKGADFDLVLYTKIGMGDGQQANNPWLQEFPDPITRVSWDNYVTVSRKDAESLGIKNYHVANGGLNGSYVNIKVGDKTLENVPAIIQPGQAPGTIGLAFGYGRKASMKEEMQTGVNAYTLYLNGKNNQSAQIELASGDHEFACVQLHNTLMGRGDILKETTLKVYNTEDAEKWNEVPMVSLDHQAVPAKTVDIWESFDRSIGHHFNLSIDLNACTGCGACVIACHAENNVPVVGKDEVRRSRDMHWLRIDRYYSSQDTFDEDIDKKVNAKGFSENFNMYKELEDPADNPQVAFQPVMCQHCNHAPCETVCPVAATSHGRQGQNAMAYNRCVGTRYCANNCPYKVRRFNWFKYAENDRFDYHMNDDLGRMVLNPDVVVRSRGVMEKCSFCIQSTQAVILQAKKEGRKVRANEFNDACACSAACDSGAMVFGDVNNPEDPIVELTKDQRAYHLLEHLNVKPNVVYQVKVRNV